MSFLTPLYLLGALAIAAPIVLHLIRRAPAGLVLYSSLLYLEPTPPRLSKRSRLEHLILLLLRAVALGLLAFAFARPYLTQGALTRPLQDNRQRVLLLVDTSASMKRTGAWPRALELARAAIDGCRPGDELAIYAFDTTTRPVLTFAESRSLNPAQLPAVAHARLDTLSPVWYATRLGDALIEAVAALDSEDGARSGDSARARSIVLVSDLGRGGRLEALGDFEWPANVVLDLQPVVVPGSNATLAPAPQGASSGSADAGTPPPARVLVTNEPGSEKDTFTLWWVGEDGRPAGDPLPAHVPAGASRVFQLPIPPGSPAQRLLKLAGDDHDFDNLAYLVGNPRESVDLWYVGDERRDDPAECLFFVSRALEGMADRSVRIVVRKPAEPLDWPVANPPALIIISGETSPANHPSLKRYLEKGGLVVCVMDQKDSAATLANLLEFQGVLEAPRIERDLILCEIAFDHPLFAPFAAAGFNDFTHIHFWKSRDLRRIEQTGRVLARFESGTPAVIEKTRGKGRILVLASSWRPSDSQLARSSKFAPLMILLLEMSKPRGRVADRIMVGDGVSLGDGVGSSTVRRLPGGRRFQAGRVFQDTEAPGVYAVERGGEEWKFAVNLDPREGRTAPYARETFEQYGCRLKRSKAPAVDAQQLALAEAAEQESRQQIWRPLVAALLCVLVLETFLAGRAGRARGDRAEVTTP